MRRSSALLLASLMLIFSLAACGSKDEPSTGANDSSAGSTAGGSDTEPGGSQNDPIAGGDTGNQNNGVQDGGMNGSGAAGDSLQDDLDDFGDDIRDDMDQAGDNIRDGMDDLTGGSASGISANGRRHLGASFGQMIRNARVHDKDGDLTDHENAVTPGSDRF